MWGCLQYDFMFQKPFSAAASKGMFARSWLYCPLVDAQRHNSDRSLYLLDEQFRGFLSFIKKEKNSSLGWVSVQLHFCKSLRCLDSVLEVLSQEGRSKSGRCDNEEHISIRAANSHFD